MHEDSSPEGAGRPIQKRGERRTAASLAVLVSMAIPFLLPDHLSPVFVRVLPLVSGVLLVALLAADPGRIDRQTGLVRGLSIAIVMVIAGTAAWTTGRLVWTLLHGNPNTADPSELLVAGALVLTDTIIAFTFVYWELDGGGPAARYFAPGRYPDFAFPPHMSPEVAPPGWHPVFVDYLYLGITNAVAFSPTDTMPLARWAKLAMALQSVISLVILSLVIANAVNLMGN